MTVATQSDDLGINFDAIAGRDTAPKGRADTALASFDPTKPLRQYSARGKLSPKQLEEVKAIAIAQYPQMKSESLALSNFGLSSMDGLNETVNAILAAQGNLKIPEVDAYIKDINRTVRGFGKKFNPMEAKTKAALDRYFDSITGIFKGGRDWLVEMHDDSKNVSVRLDGIAKSLVKDQMQLERNVVLCDELYDKNEAALTQLVGVIAIMEEISDLALADSKQLQQDIAACGEGDAFGKRDLEERLARTTEFQTSLEIRINEFIQRMFVGWTTSPQIRNIRTISYGLSQRLDLLVRLTIPALKLTVATWGALVQAKKAAEVVTKVNDINNQALQGLASAAKQSIPVIAAAIQSPSTRPETIMLITDSIVSQNESLTEAFRVGQEQRALVVDAVVQAGNLIGASGKKRDAEIINLIERARRPLEITAAPEVPAEIAIITNEAKAA